jgi:hypothetical protein
MKKPTTGKPMIGAQFVSFNFPSRLICAEASRRNGHCHGYRARPHRRRRAGCGSGGLIRAERNMAEGDHPDLFVAQVEVWEAKQGLPPVRS